jgi:FHS family L-fucose permease-like MFS transporter
LETAANSYITCLPGTEASGAAFRLQLSQSFNGIASFAGPFIASKYFFSGSNASNLTNVQWVYLAVALMGAFIAFLFTIYTLPETSEAELEQQVQTAAEMTGLDSRTDLPFYKVCRFVYAASIYSRDAISSNTAPSSAGLHSSCTSVPRSPSAPSSSTMVPRS